MANPFAGSRGYARLSNLFMRPLFSLLKVPGGFALLTVTGRRSGKQRQRPVRAVRSGDTLYIVAMLGERADWLRNVRRKPHVRIKIGRCRYDGSAREVSDPAELRAALELYVQGMFRADYIDYAAYHWDWPTRRKIQKAHRQWTADGVIVAVDIERPEAVR